MRFYTHRSLSAVTDGTAFQFRLCFYALLSACWGLIAYRYSPRFGRGVTVLTPVLLLAMLPLFPDATCILSEQMQAIGMVILGFELLQFRTSQPLPCEHPLWKCPRLLLSPHNSFVGEGNHGRLFSLICRNLQETDRECERI